MTEDTWRDVLRQIDEARQRETHMPEGWTIQDQTSDTDRKD